MCSTNRFEYICVATSPIGGVAQRIHPPDVLIAGFSMQVASGRRCDSNHIARHVSSPYPVFHVIPRTLRVTAQNLGETAHA